jgi:hypothetical protein
LKAQTEEGLLYIGMAFDNEPPNSYIPSGFLAQCRVVDTVGRFGYCLSIKI